MVKAQELARVAIQEAKKKYLYSNMDCQGFVEHCMKVAGKKIAYRGSNDMIRELVINLKPIDENIKSGTLVFMVRKDGREPLRYTKGGAGYRVEFDGWNAHHVGIYVGNGLVAESSMSRGQTSVEQMKLRKPKWDYYGEIKGVDYSEADVSASIPLKPKEQQDKEDCGVDTNIKLYTALVKPNTRFLNVRKKPTRQSTSLDKLQDLEIIQIEPCNEEWCKAFDMQGVFMGYCMTKFLYVDTEERLAKEIENLKNAMENLRAKAVKEMKAQERVGGR